MNAYLPDDQELHKAPKAWICNVINTVVKDHFKAWVKNQVADRNELVKSKKNIMIAMDPGIYQAFAASTKLSLSKGVSSNMMKTVSKRRRTRREIEDEKQKAHDKEMEVLYKLANLDRMEAQIQELKQQAELNKNQNTLQMMQLQA